MYLPSWGGRGILGECSLEIKVSRTKWRKKPAHAVHGPGPWGDWEIGPSGFPLPFPVRTPPIPGPTERTATPRPMESSEEQLDQMAPAMLWPLPNSDLTR